MISTLYFKTSRWAFRPWLKPSGDYVTTFRVFTELIEKSCEKASRSSNPDAYTHRTTQ